MAVFRHEVNGIKTGVNLKRAPKAASTAITENTVLTRNSDGRLIPAVAASTFIAGVAVTRVVAADANFASTDRIVYDEPREAEMFIMDVDDASTAGFVPGVERALVNAGVIKAAAVGGGEAATVVVHEVFTSQNKALVTFKTKTI